MEGNIGVKMSNHCQTSICEPISLSGISLHNGHMSCARFLPALPHQGIVFEVGDDRISATIGEVPKCTNFTTELSNKRVHVRQIEHIMAALAGIGIDNVIIQLLGDEELPILDGSSAIYASKLLSIGLWIQNEPRTELRVSRSFCVKDDNDRSRYICAEPADRLVVVCEVDYDSPVGRLHYKYVHSKDRFLAEIAPARTFHPFEKSLGELRQRLRGLRLATEPDGPNVILINGNRYSVPLRFEDEPVRHKILDFLGDLRLLGHPIIGRFTLVKPGHSLNVKFTRQLKERV